MLDRIAGRYAKPVDFFVGRRLIADVIEHRIDPFGLNERTW